MKKILIFAFFFAVVSVCRGANPTPDTIVWDVNNLESIGGHTTTVTGSPKVIKTEKGKAVQFNGLKDGLTVDAVPIAGAEKFTVEIILRPDGNTPAGAQRFFHIQENNSKNRILILLETLPPQNDKWYLDTYVKSDKGSQNLYKPAITHTLGKWYNAAIVYDGQEIRHYTNGVKEAVGKLEFSPLSSNGKASIGMKLNKTFWFKGVICKIRFTKRALEPKEFLQP
jgi:hypothetical protein